MFWNRLVSLVVGGGLMIARPLSPADRAPVLIGELLSYDCARAIGGMNPSSRRPGPLFREGDLVFASLETADHRSELMISAGGGIFALELLHAGVNRLRFELTNPAGHAVLTYYLSYLHDVRLGSRYLEFAVGRPPVGHFEFDYLAVIPQRASYLGPHLDYAAYVTSVNLRRAVIERRLARGEIRGHVAGACDYLSRDNPALARGLRENLNDLDRGPGRTPASLR